MALPFHSLELYWPEGIPAAVPVPGASHQRLASIPSRSTFDLQYPLGNNHI